MSVFGRRTRLEAWATLDAVEREILCHGWTGDLWTLIDAALLEARIPEAVRLDVDERLQMVFARLLPVPGVPDQERRMPSEVAKWSRSHSEEDAVNIVRAARERLASGHDVR